MALSYEEIAEILKIIDGSSCEEVIVETTDVRLVIRRNGAAGAPAPAFSAPAFAAAPAAVPAAPSAAPQPAPAQPEPPAASPAPGHVTAAHQIEIAAPMVGTFYRARAPDAPPFVEIGSTVRKGDPLCLIEVMKLFTTIAAEHDGRIVHIGARNGELVEYGRTLFVIEPSSN